ncbi:MAG: ATP-binding cassette domain-containing protein, partial [Pseudomonadales bacterium]
MNEGGSQHFGFSDQARVSISKTFFLGNLDWQIEPGARWLVLGTNGSGKSALISALMGFGDIRKGRRQLPRSFALVSSRFQAELIERETALERGDLSDQVFTGTPAGTILRELDPEEARLSFL